jgi:hypothetical protein
LALNSSRKSHNANFSGDGTIPSVGPFVGDAPEDRHAERVVAMMLTCLDDFAATVQPQLGAAMGARISRLGQRSATVRGQVESGSEPGDRQCRWGGRQTLPVPRSVEPVGEGRIRRR